MARNTSTGGIRSYFVFRFCCLGLKEFLMVSSTTSCAIRSVSVRFFTLGKANGWPIPHSVLFLFELLFFAFFAMPSE
jgi:hypothetical protein